MMARSKVENNSAKNTGGLMNSAGNATNNWISRRQLLKVGAVGALGMGLPGMVTASLDPERPLGGEAAERSCIFLWLCGGPSHLDTWDLKPNAPECIRGPYRPIATAVP